jgi:L,D-transpeptidase YcbB
MKIKLLFLIAITFFVISCKNNEKENADKEIAGEDVDAIAEDTVKAKKVTDRDFSVTADNAYNDMFLDSLSMEKYISDNQLGNKKIARRIRSFYNARNYQYAWFSTTGVTEQARFFWNQYDYAVSYLKDSSLINRTFYKKAESFLNQEKLTVSKSDTSLMNTEFAFTENFIRFINSTYEKGYVKRKEQEKFVPIKKADPLYLADSILNKKHSDDKYYEPGTIL